MRNMLFVLIGFMFLSYAGFAYAAPGDERWSTMNPEPAGSAGPVRMMIGAGEHLYLAGDFFFSGPIPSGSVARVHIPTGFWEPLGDQIDIVYDMAATADGRVFAYATDTAGNSGIFLWAGVEWVLLANIDVQSMAIDGAGHLYVAGNFQEIAGSPVNRIARWDGVVWEDLGGERPFEPYVIELVVDAAGTVYFHHSGFDGVNGVWRRVSTDWELLYAYEGTDSWENSFYYLFVDDDGRLYGARDIQLRDGSPASELLRWESGVAWSRAFLTDGHGSLKGSFLDGEGGLIGFSGDAIFRCAAGGGCYRETPQGPGTIEYLVPAKNGAWYVGGKFPGEIAFWDGSGVWRLAEKGFKEGLAGLATDSEGTLYLERNLYTDAFLIVSEGRIVARFPGIYFNAFAPFVFDAQDRLLVNGWGDFSRGYFVSSRIGRWNGTDWDLLGDDTYPGHGTPMGGVAAAYALDSAGALYVAGQFGQFGAAANNIAQWNDEQFLGLGAGTDGPVRAVAATSAGSIYAGGLFTEAGGVAAAHVARWDGTTWHPLGEGTDGPVNTLAVGPTGTLYAGGFFTEAGGKPASHIARWDGTAWHLLGSGMNGEVHRIVIDSAGRLYAAGAFTEAGGVAARHIARWDGTAWHSLGSGTDAPVTMLAAGKNDTLYVGGDFTRAGDKTTFHLAAYSTAGEDPVGIENDEEDPLPDTDTIQPDETADDPTDDVPDLDSPLTTHDSLLTDTDIAPKPKDDGCGCALLF